MKTIVMMMLLLSACAAAVQPAPCMSPGDCELMNSARTHCYLRADYAGRGVCLCDPVAQ
jgi:hypothetical protein